MTAAAATPQDAMFEDLFANLLTEDPTPRPDLRLVGDTVLPERDDVEPEIDDATATAAEAAANRNSLFGPAHPDPPGTGRLKVRVAPVSIPCLPTPASDGELSETSLNRQLIVDYTRTLAMRTRKRINEGDVEYIEHPHRHPQKAPCLRCAVLGSSGGVTLASTLLEILALTGADEEWNRKEGKPKRITSRLNRLSKSISSVTMSRIYGEHWGEVMLTCLRIEASEFERLHYLTREHRMSKTLTSHTRSSLAAYQLARIATPWTSVSSGKVSGIQRNAVAAQLAAQVALVAEGAEPEWIDHLPAPLM